MLEADACDLNALGAYQQVVKGFDDPITVQQTLQEFVDDDLIKPLYKAAQKKAKSFKEPGDINMLALDRLKRSLDDQISEAKRKGRNNDALDFTLKKNALKSLLIQQNPAYGEALETFSSHSDFDYIDISSQNIHWEDEGAFTAEISPKMLLEHGVSYAIVGHSEPRKYFSESDEQINKRAVFAQSSGLTPIVCVGETLEQRERGEAVRVITRQVEQGLENTDPSNLIVAYEPIWAIGTGKTCEAEDANKICSLIRKLIGFDDVIIQYGGSVKPNNIDEIMSMSDIDGVLVGGASLDPNSFARIANYQ